MLKKILIPILFILFTSCGPSGNAPEKTITFKVFSETLPPGAKIYVAGNDKKLGNWLSGRTPLSKQDDGSWTRTFEFTAGQELEFKFTKGTWETEAVDENNLELSNFEHRVTEDTTLIYQIVNWRDQVKVETVLSQKRFANKAGYLELVENWKYHSGDDSTWADPDLDDSSWETTGTVLDSANLPSSGWNGIGWFRLHITVDSTFWHVPLALSLFQTGASEIYLNGKLLYQFGAVGLSLADEKIYWEKNPKHITFDGQYHNVLAVRYSNFSYEKIKKYNVGAGFYITLRELDTFVSNRINHVRAITSYQYIFSIAPLALALVHLLLFAFYPGAKENLFYALAMTFFAILSYTNFSEPFLSDIGLIIKYNIIANTSALFAVTFALFTAYYSFSFKAPKYAYAFFICAIFLSSFFWFSPVQLRWINFVFYSFLVLTTLEIIRILIKSGLKKEFKGWITGFGLLIAILSFIYQILISISILNPIGGSGVVYVYGVMILGIAFSVNLSLNFARTQKNLKHQLVQVKQLSQKALEQERHARDEEINKRLLEADNARKTQELEEARNLQLSMLPKKIPQLPNLDIAVYMQPATEVGGDYYDFHLAKDNTLTIAIGDATGHGTKAGTMVASIKSLFNAFGGNLEITGFFSRCTTILKDMNLGNLYMAMMLMRIQNNKLTASAAGMPPVLIYKNKTKTVEELIMKGMPLGGSLEYEYKLASRELAVGDTLLLMSDGFPELFNEKKEMLDYPQVKQIFAETAEKSPQDILSQLKKSIVQWSDGRPQNDDITFIILKVK